ncbi:MAG: glycosyltransferase family 4 protein [Ilumatobacteraceae bacterium]
MKLTVSIVTEGDPDQISGGFLYQRRVAELAPAHGAEVRFVSLPARRYPLGAVHARRLLRAATDADVVVVDSLASNTLGPWLARGIDRPLVGSVHQQLGGSEGSSLGRMTRRRADLLAWRTCRHIIVPSELLAGQLRSDGLVGPDIVVVNPGSDIPEHDGPIRRDVDLRRGRQAAVLCVASWLERKGILALLEAVAELPGDLVTVHLVGNEDADRAYGARVLERLAREDLAGRVVRHGTVRPERMVDLYAAADVFSLPSSEEPYGMVYAEAMTAGLPIVGWAAGNLPHLIDDGVEGRLVAPGDVVSLSRGLAELAFDADLRRRLGTAAQRRAQDLPTWDDTTAGFVDVCRRASRSA